MPAQMLGVTSGPGHEILDSRDRLAHDEVTAVIPAIGLPGYLLVATARCRTCAADWSAPARQSP